MYYEKIHTENYKGFDIVYSVAHEDSEPDWYFESEDEKRDVLRRIENGDSVWFIARVQAFKHGILLGDDYLSGCYYDSYAQFLQDYDVIMDLVEDAIAEASEMIKKLNQ